VPNVESYDYKGFKAECRTWLFNTAIPWCRARSDFAFAWSVADNDGSEAKHDLSTVLWAVGFFLTQGLALIASVQNTNPVSEFRRGDYVLKRMASEDEQFQSETKSTQLGIKIFIYLFSTLFPFGILCNIVRSKTKYGPVHFYGRPTVSAARWSKSVGSLFVVTIVGLAHAQSLPGQTIHVTATDTAPYRFKTDGTDGIAATISFSVEAMPGEDDVLHFAATVGPSLRNDWRLAFVSATVKYPNGQIENVVASPDPVDLLTKNPVSFPLLDAKPGRQFKLTFLLKPKDGKRPPPDREKALAILSMDGMKAFSLTLVEP
jgi:hypothetical protein